MNLRFVYNSNLRGFDLERCKSEIIGNGEIYYTTKIPFIYLQDIHTYCESLNIKLELSLVDDFSILCITTEDKGENKDAYNSG